MKIGAVVILLNACIWGTVIIFTSLALKGTGEYQNIQNILIGGAGASLILVGGGVASLKKKPKAS
ncbi:MAG: hypothetical protein KOO60_01415 [Gemmatimonadales bacterium]|nr:hypothetical protein [Gemmatimonadales bacterium]